jgi:hypothetical protein
MLALARNGTSLYFYRMPDVIRVSPDQYNYTQAYREHGNMKYLAEGETFEGVVAHDAAILAECGVSQEEVGLSLRGLFSTLNTFLPSRAPQVNEPVPGIVLSRQVFELGQEHSPYLRGAYSNTDWYVYTENMSNGNKAYHPISGPTIVSDMLPEMIAQLGFFEGTVYYGIDPLWAVAIHRLMEKYRPEPYVPVYTMEAWDSITWYSPTKREFEDIAAKHIYEEEFLPGVKALIALGKIAPHGWDRYTGEPLRRFKFDYGPKDKRKIQLWALLIAEEDTRIPPNATLAGYPLAKHCNEVRKGLSYARFFPYNQQQVG